MACPFRLAVSTTILSIACVLSSQKADAADLQPHRAVYDLTLAKGRGSLDGATGSITVKLTQPDCRSFAIDYRFEARFRADGKETKARQHSVFEESAAGDSFAFGTSSDVDGVAAGETKGIAATTDRRTVVRLEKPAERSVTLRPSVFPLAHTRDLIDAGRAGRTIVTAALYEGDADAANASSVTSILTPVAPSAKEDADNTGKARKGEASDPARLLAGLSAWRVDESYYDRSSKPDGLPVFRTRYTLFDNGVSGAVVLDFGDYALAGSLRDLAYLPKPSCEPSK